MKSISILLLFSAFCFAQAPAPSVQVINMSSQAPIRSILPMANLPPFVEVFVLNAVGDAFQATITYHGYDGKQYTATQISSASNQTASLVMIYVDAATVESAIVQPLKFTGVVVQ